jgi:hypothetical protein
MAMVQYTAEVKGSRLLELPTEADELHLQPGDTVQVQLARSSAEAPLVESNDSDDKRGIAVRLPKNKRRITNVSPIRVSAMGKYAGVLSSEEFLRRKQEDIALEDRPTR